MEERTKNCALVRPSTSRSNSSSMRVAIITISAMALAATVCVLFNISQGADEDSALAQVAALAFGDSSFHADASPTNREGSVRNGVKPNFVPPLGDVGLKVTAKPQALAITGIKNLPNLAFGDSSFHADLPSSTKEGSVRKGVKPDFVPPLGTLGEIGLKNTVKPQALAIAPLKSQSRLAFGDFAIHHDISPESKEGSVRKGIKPDFVPPLGTLGETGLKVGVAPQALAAAKPQKSLPRLSFGDAVFQPEKEDPATREGSVRKGIKPDFVPPIGDLGEIGLAKKHPLALHGQSLSLKPIPAVQVKKIPQRSAALAFGDATFIPSRSPSASREGSVRGSVRPDFKPPLGDLGEVGLKAAVKGQTLAAAKKPAVAKQDLPAHIAKMSDESSRSALESFYSEQLHALKTAKAEAYDEKHLSASTARAGLEAYYEAKVKADSVSGHSARPAATADLTDKKAREVLKAFYDNKKAEEKSKSTLEAVHSSQKTAPLGLSSYYAVKTAADQAERLKAVRILSHFRWGVSLTLKLSG